MRSSRGFTIIELLVVIAIIGILASLVIASLNNARGKATDTRIRSSVNQLRTLAELLYGNGGQKFDLVTTCINATATATTCGQKIADSINILRADIKAANGQATPLTAAGKDQKFCISAVLSDGKTARCVDATGIYIENKTTVCQPIFICKP